MDRFLQWWKQDKRYMTMAKAVLLALLPVACCLVYCAAQGKTLDQVFLPASEWNDELFYYKQVEGIINYGYPQGYFGFNESHALKLSFAAWSPVLVFPWVIWGLLFGWNFMSPIICNIFLMSLCCFLFVWLVNPGWKQTGVLALLFCLYHPFVRYMLAGMPELICFIMLILFYGLAINYTKREKAWKLALLFVLSGVMVLMRPYLALFLLLPMYLWIKRSRWKGLLGSALVLGMVMAVYACIKHYLSAAYFEPLFYTDWITAFFERGMLEGLRFTLGRLYSKGIPFLQFSLEGFRSGIPVGAYFDGYLAILLLLLIQGWIDYRRVRRLRKAKAAETEGNIGIENDIQRQENQEIKNRLIIEAHLAFSFVAMVVAILLMYKTTESSRHLMTFTAAGIFVVSMMETKFYKKAVFLGVIFVYLYSFKAVWPHYYQVPFATEELRQQMQEWTTAMAEEMPLDQESVPNFENVVIWTLDDVTPLGVVSTSWQLLYGLPSGFGISCCDQGYVLDNLETLKSRYLLIPTGGDIDWRCREMGYGEVWRDDSSVLYVLVSNE